MSRLPDRSTTAFWLLALWTVCCTSGLSAATLQKPELDHVVIDGVKLPLDKTVEVVGISQLAGNSFRDSHSRAFTARVAYSGPSQPKRH